MFRGRPGEGRSSQLGLAEGTASDVRSSLRTVLRSSSSKGHDNTPILNESIWTDNPLFCVLRPIPCTADSSPCKYRRGRNGQVKKVVQP